MIVHTTDIKTRDTHLDKFLEQAKKNNPEKLMLTPKSMRLFNMKVTYSKECNGNPDMLALKDKMAALNNKYSAYVGFICKCAAEVQLKVFCKLCLEEFVIKLIKVIKKRVSSKMNQVSIFLSSFQRLMETTTRNSSPSRSL
jgi:hypothetical protein